MMENKKQFQTFYIFRDNIIGKGEMKKSQNTKYVRYQQQQQSQEQSQQEEEHSRYGSGKSHYLNVPRFIKNQIDESEITEIILNTSKTHYEVIEKVGQQLGWTLSWSKKSHKWDVMWVDGFIQAHDLFKLNQHQKISHFPAISVLARKDLLGRGLNKLGKAFPESYDFFPTTWAIPAEYNDLIRYNEILKKQERKEFFIFKPQSSSQGKGIKITDRIQQLSQKTGVVQLYVNSPYLIQGLKFDLRIYVLLVGCDPLRIYIYEQGLGRFATEQYKKVKKKNIKQSCMHLTNYAINKNNNKFVFNQSQKNMNKGHKRSLTSVYSYLQKSGVDIAEIKRKIDDLIVKTMIMGQPMLAHIYGLSQPDNYANNMCFQILGFDVLIDQNLNPILLQVNHTPSFATDTPLDSFIKKNLIKDTLNILNVNIQTKKSKIQQKQQFIQLRSQNKNVKLSTKQKAELKRQAQQERDQYQNKNLGKFKRLLVEGKQYSQMLKISKKLFDDHYGFRKKGSSIKGYSLQRPFSLTKSVQKKNGSHRESLNDPGKQILTSQSQLATRSLKNSHEKFPTIDIQKNSKIPYICPIVSQINKYPDTKYRNKQKLLGLKPSSQLIRNHSKASNRGNVLAPKTLKLGEIGDLPFRKERIQKYEQALCQNPSSSVKLSIRKKIQCENILKTLIFKKIKIGIGDESTQ